MCLSDHVFDLRKRSRTFFGECPYCHGKLLKKFGKEHERQRWACANCGRTFSDSEAGGLAGTGDSEDAFLGHIAPGSCVYHDMGHFGSCFPGCREKAVNSEDPAAHCLLNLVNRLRAQVKRMFAVHLRIHRKNVPLWLNEKAFQKKKMGSMGFCRCLSFFYRRIFLSGKTLRRQDVFAH